MDLKTSLEVVWSKELQNIARVKLQKKKKSRCCIPCYTTEECSDTTLPAIYAFEHNIPSLWQLFC